MKFVHLMVHHSTVHNPRIVEMIMSNPDYFSGDEHIFVVSSRAVYDEINKKKKYENVVLEEGISRDCETLKKYIDESDYVFLHENMTIPARVLCKLGPSRLEKIIWVVWGHDLYLEPVWRSLSLFDVKSRLSLLMKERATRKYHAIGIGFKYDAIEVHKCYPEAEIVFTPYGYLKGYREEFDKVLKKTGKKKDGQPVKVMVGHSAFNFLNYFDTFEKLKKYRDDNILISLVLAYGDKQYARSVEKRAIEIFGSDKVEIIEKMMNIDEYHQYLASVDIAILNFKKQAALGNFYDLCYMGKKLFLADGGILDIAAKSEKMKTFNLSEIKNMSFEEFSDMNFSTENERKFGEFYVDENNLLKMWKDTIAELKVENN